MHSLEALEGQIAALALRMARLESWQRSGILTAGSSGAAAQAAALAVAKQLGLPAGVLVETMQRPARRRLAVELHHAKGWSADRIARLFHISNRTAVRWISVPMS